MCNYRADISTAMLSPGSPTWVTSFRWFMWISTGEMGRGYHPRFKIFDYNMLIFILAVLLLVIYNYRGYIKNVAKTLKPRGVDIPEFEKFKIKYPTYYKNTMEHLNIFNVEYQKTFDMDHIGPAMINNLFSIRDDVLYNISEIRLRLPNDLDLEKSIARVYESADRRMMEYLTDVKSRFHIDIYPGQTSSSFSARAYRASNDMVL